MYKVLRPQCKIMSQIQSKYVLLVKTREVLQGERGDAYGAGGMEEDI